MTYMAGRGLFSKALGQLEAAESDLFARGGYYPYKNEIVQRISLQMYKECSKDLLGLAEPHHMDFTAKWDTASVLLHKGYSMTGHSVRLLETEGLRKNSPRKAVAEFIAKKKPALPYVFFKKTLA